MNLCKLTNVIRQAQSVDLSRFHRVEELAIVWLKIYIYLQFKPLFTRRFHHNIKLHTWTYIGIVNGDVILLIGTLVFVLETNGVHQFVHDRSRIIVTDAIVGQANILRTVAVHTHVAPASDL